MITITLRNPKPSLPIPTINHGPLLVPFVIAILPNPLAHGYYGHQAEIIYMLRGTLKPQLLGDHNCGHSDRNYCVET